VSLFGGRRDDAPSAGAGAPGQPGSSPDTWPQATAGGEQVMANIGKSISIKGDLSGNEDLEIEGKVEGKVELPNNQLTIGSNGDVQAQVTAKSVVIVGRVAGDVHGTERVEIQATGVVEGDVTAPKLIVAEGARLNGSIHMTEKGGGKAGSSPEVLKTA
jgi:cytoskeletal protein CcmA (bactofilin family)